jgi:hypothetical protein
MILSPFSDRQPIGWRGRVGGFVLSVVEVLAVDFTNVLWCMQIISCGLGRKLAEPVPKRSEGLA